MLFLFAMGNYIANNSTKKNALRLITKYMVKTVPKRFRNGDEERIALMVSRDVFKRIIKLSASPINILERMYDEIEECKDDCGLESVKIYEISKVVIDDILEYMS